MYGIDTWRHIYANIIAKYCYDHCFILWYVSLLFSCQQSQRHKIPNDIKHLAAAEPEFWGDLWTESWKSTTKDSHIKICEIYLYRHIYVYNIVDKWAKYSLLDNAWMNGMHDEPIVLSYGYSFQLLPSHEPWRIAKRRYNFVYLCLLSYNIQLFICIANSSKIQTVKNDALPAISSFFSRTLFSAE